VGEGRWEDLGHGLFRVVGAPETWHQRLWLGVLEAPDGALISHRSVAELSGLPGYRGQDVDVLTPVNLDHRARHSTLHQTRDLPASHATTIHGLPCTTLARTVFDLSASANPKWLGIVTDAALHRCGLEIADLVDVTVRLAKRGRRGSRAMRAVVSARMDGYIPTESVLEAEFVVLCETYNLPQPERQVLLGDDAAAIGRVDFYFPDARLIVEVDGRPYHSSLTDRDADRRRDNRFTALGIRVIRLTWADVVRDPAASATLVRRALRAATATAA
jgi:hypothetical protein